MRRREFIKAFAVTATWWPLPAGAQIQPVPLRASPTQPTALTEAQLHALEAYNKALTQFKSILSERRTRISSHRSLPDLPGQALYLARVNVMSTYKDLTDALPSKIGRANKFGAPPAYLDAANAEVAGRISLGLFFAETDGKQNIGNARSHTYKGSLQTGPSEDRSGQKKWSTIKKSIAVFYPALSARDSKED